MKKTIIIGYGNPGRLDDGLGAAFVEIAEKWDLSDVETDSDYQLTVEYSAEIVPFQRVIFVDAAETGPEPFSFTRLRKGSSKPTFSSHHVNAAGVLALAADLFDVHPEAWLLGVRGYEFNLFGEKLSIKAQENLTKAGEFLYSSLLKDHLFEKDPQSKT